mmetsp:Transcript_8174/g.13197  ORF Transcript_8174/g.13197 Transcript_8174/m.13197 type:complete len:332 (-) Transcript_8174:412-1407(-)
MEHANRLIEGKSPAVLATSAATGLVAARLVWQAIKALCLSDADLVTYDAVLQPEYFRSKVVFITGGSSGIGKQIAIELDRLNVGVKIVLGARRVDALEEASKTLKCESKCVRVDLENLESLENVVKEVTGVFGRVDILVNNGGISTRAFAAETSFNVDERVMKINYLSHAKLAKLVLPGMIQRKQGHIINISSLAGKLGSPLRSAYSASKFAVLGFFNCVRLEVFEHGVHVTNVCPGSVQTDVARNALLSNGSQFNSEDPHIANGQTVERCARLVLAAASNHITESWFFGSPKEKLASYFSQYCPGTFSNAIVLMSAKLCEQARTLLAKNK